MKKLFPIFLLPILLSSCATMLNGYYTDVRVHAHPGDVVTYKNERGVTDTAYLLKNDTYIFPALRAKKPLEVSVISDTSRQDLTVKWIYSGAYYLNLYPTYGLGMLVDAMSPKRFGYPTSIYPYRPVRKGYLQVRPFTPGVVSITVQPPIVMGYFLNPESFDFSGNVLGGGLGVNYCYKKATFLSGDIAGATAWKGRRGRYVENANGGYRRQDFYWISLALRNHHAFGRLDLGYGLSGSWQRCRESDVYDYYNRKDEKVLVREETPLTLGLAAAINFRLTNEFCVGFNYQPQFLNISGNGATAAYSHISSVGFFWRFSVAKQKR